MRKLLSRLSWQNYSLSEKIRLLVLSQAVLLLFIAVILLIVQANLRNQARQINDSVVEANVILSELEASEVEMLRLEQEVTTGYTSIDYDPEGEQFNGTYDRAVGDIRDNLAELETILTRVAPDEASADSVRDVVLSLSNNLTDRRRVFRSALDVTLLLSDPDNGGLIGQLDEQGDQVGRLAVLQSAEVNDTRTANDLVTQGVLIRRLEDQLITFGSDDELDLLQTAVADLGQTYESLPPSIRVANLPQASEDYLETAQAIYNELQNLQLLTASLNNEVSVYNSNFETLRTVTNEQSTSLNNSLVPAERLGQGILIGGLLIAILFGALLTSSFGRSLNQSVAPLMTASSALETGELSARAEIFGNDEFTQLSSSFNSMASQLEGLVVNLEQRVAERTRDLIITAEIGRAVTASTSEQELMNDVVELIRERFGFYHAQIFIVDPQGVNAELAASTGSAGRELLSRQHFLPVGSQSVIGRVTDEGVPVIALDTSEDPTHRRNELLPDTRAEMALPMRVGERIIGALDVQSVSPNAFNEDTVAVFQTMADQLAVALENARLYTALQQAQTALQAREEQSTLESWRAYRREKEGMTGFAMHGDIVIPVSADDVTPVMEEAVLTQQVVHYVGNGSAELAIPIVVRGVAVGAFNFAGEEIIGLTDEELGLIEAIMERVTLALDNIRLVEETVRRAEYEQVVNEITAKIVGQTDINYILQTTVQELGRILRSPRTSVQLKREGDA